MAPAGPGASASTLPPPGGSSYQIKFKAPAGEGEPWKPVLRRVNTEAEARKIFVQAEEALDHEQAAPASAKVRATRTIEALAAEYIADSKRRGMAPRTIQGRESRVNAHVLSAIGHVPVAKWRVEDSQQVVDRASKTVHSARGREDVRGVLAAMRKFAWRLEWLDRRFDPLDGLEIRPSSVLQGATTQYVDPCLRPETSQVKAMADVADALCGPEAPTHCSRACPTSVPRSASPASAGSVSVSRMVCGRLTSSSAAATPRSTAAGSLRAIPRASAVR